MESNTQVASDLLTEIAGELWAQANDAVPAVLAGYGDQVTPTLRHFVEAQRTDYERITGQPMVPSAFQLPEPMLHPVDRPLVLVLGWNPGYSPDELLPTLSVPLEEYVGFYQDRFGSHLRTSPGRRPANWVQGSPHLSLNKHYNKVERLLERAGFGALGLSETATYVDAIPWKGTQPSFRDPAIVALAMTRLRRLTEGLRPRLILSLGNDVASFLGVRDLMEPATHSMTIGDWEGLVVPMYHPASYGYLTNAYLDRVAAAIRSAVASAAPDLPTGGSTMGSRPSTTNPIANPAV